MPKRSLGFRSVRKAGMGMTPTPISHEFLTRMMEGKEIDRVQVSAADGQFAYAFD